MKTGRCLCGGIRFEYGSENGNAELFAGHCHCESCRRQTASPFTTFVGVANGTWRWTGGRRRCFKARPVRFGISVEPAVRRWLIHHRAGPMKSTFTPPFWMMHRRSSRVSITIGRNGCIGPHRRMIYQRMKARLQSSEAKAAIRLKLNAAGATPSV
jgi:hypothetical protein